MDFSSPIATAGWSGHDAGSGTMLRRLGFFANWLHWVPHATIFYRTIFCQLSPVGDLVCSDAGVRSTGSCGQANCGKTGGGGQAGFGAKPSARCVAKPTRRLLPQRHEF
jgi:hypothetical protein